MFGLYLCGKERAEQIGLAEEQRRPGAEGLRVGMHGRC